MTETQLSRDIQDALEGLGALVVRVQSGKHRSGPHWIQCAAPGTPDLVVIWRGHTTWLEVKTESGDLSHEQDSWHRAARQQGARVHIVRSVEQALRVARGVQ